MERNQSKPELSSIVDPSYLQAVHDMLADDMQLKGIQVAFAILDGKATPITFELNHSDFCKEVRRTKAGVTQCRTSDLRGIDLAKKHFLETGKAEPEFYICDQGLVDFCAPIVVGEGEDQKIVAYLFGGQFKCPPCKWRDRYITTPDKPTLASLYRISRENNDDPPRTEELTAKFKRTQWVDKNKFKEFLDAANAISHQLNSVVGKLYKAKRVEMVEDFMEKTKSTQSVDSLLDLMIDKLPEMMEAKHCSIFSVQEDERGCERLVLRKTTYPGLKPQENSAYYDKGRGLTGWVWKHGRSLRLKDVDNKADLQQYGEDLKWEQIHNDSDEHKGFLCVPMVGRNNKIIGVIRVPHKVRKPPESGEERAFTKHDEIFLNFLAGYISRAMECQAAEDKFEQVVRSTGLVPAAVELFSARSYSKVLDAGIKSSLALFSGSGKKHFVNMLERNKLYWRVERIGGTLGLSAGYEDLEGRRFSINDGITGRAIREGRACLSSDLPESERKGEYIPATRNGRSAMSAPLIAGSEIYGAISIVSDKEFEFSTGKDLELLDCLAKLTGAAIRNAKSRYWLLRSIGELGKTFLKLCAWLRK